MPCIKSNASKFKVRKMVLDTNLNMVNSSTFLLFFSDPYSHLNYVHSLITVFQKGQLHLCT